MSNQTLKDWRERMAYEAIKEPRRGRYRDRLDAMMVIATILSSVATTAAVIVGVYQYGAAMKQVSVAQEQTTAADRNRTFEDFLKAFDGTCSIVNRDFGMTIVTSLDQSFDENRVSHVADSTVDLAFEGRASLAGLRQSVGNLYQQLRYFKVWAPNDDFVADIGEMLSVFQFPDEGFLGIMGQKHNYRSMWKISFVQMQALCSVAPDELIGYMRYGRRPDLRAPVVQFHKDGVAWP